MTRPTRRLFLGCPLPSDAATELHRWSSDRLAALGVRVISAKDLHVTLMFFGDVSAEVACELQHLLADVVWASVHVATRSLCSFGRNAYGVELEANSSELIHLEDRLGRASICLTQEEASQILDPDSWSRLFRQDDPLVKMSRHVPHAENERKARRQRQGVPLRLHVTLARLPKDFSAELDRLVGPTLEFELGAVALFESMPGPNGSSYEIVAQSKSS